MSCDGVSLAICVMIATGEQRSVKKAYNEGALTAARRILAGEPSPQISDRVRIDEDLLVWPGSGARP